MVESLVNWTTSFGVGQISYVRTVFAISETFHFVGLSLLIGTVSMMDLRLLGVAKALPFAPLYRLLYWGIAGIFVNLFTGIFFWFASPTLYAVDQSVPFFFKLLFLSLAGINALVFRLTVHREAMSLGPGEDAPPLAKVMAGTSLFLWVGVIWWGRLIMYA